eukprot:sb/3466528/
MFELSSTQYIPLLSDAAAVVVVDDDVTCSSSSPDSISSSNVNSRNNVNTLSSSPPSYRANNVNSALSSSPYNVSSSSSSSDDSAYYGSPPRTPDNVPLCNITYHPTSTPNRLPRELQDLPVSPVDPSYPLHEPYPTPKYCPGYLENLQNKIMRRKGSVRSDKEKSTLSYLKCLSREERYEEMFVILENFSFSVTNHRWLQTLWLRGHYTREAARLGRGLAPADRTRIKRQFPFPTAITSPQLDIEDHRYSKDFLKVFYGINEYPSPGEKMMLSVRCKMTYHQVNSWFKNRRARDREALAVCGTEFLPPASPQSPEQLDETLDLMMDIIKRDPDCII